MTNKKANTTFEVVFWIPRIIFLVVLMFAIMILIRSFVTTIVESSELEANLFANRVLYSPNGISYADSDTHRIYPGIIDSAQLKSKIDGKLLDKSINYGKKNLEIGAKFSLSYAGDKVDFFYNEDFFKEQFKIADSGFTKGPGGAKAYTKKYNVRVLKDNGIYNGLITMNIVIPNS